MANSKKIRVMVLYGGRSGEHEVSLRSAASVIRYIDSERFEVIPVAIDKQGKWLLNDVSLIAKSAESLPVYKDAPNVVLPPNPEANGTTLIPLGSSSSGNPSPGKKQGIDVVFPVMHGPHCEDGTIQGLLELADVPYVGAGVLGSAVGMDKDVAKRLMRDAGIAVVPFIALKAESQHREKIGDQVAKELGYPVFVKPANMGSSVGVHKVKEASQLEAALKDAFQYDTKILIEKAIDAREIELSVLENSSVGGHPLVSTPGEIISTHEFYSYEAKYLDENGAQLVIPARLDAGQVAIAQKIAISAFEVLECSGMARVDLFLDRKTGALYFNEINTLPGFTSISMYPKMWEHSGISYMELLSRLLDLAMARHERKKKLITEFHGAK